MFEDIQLIYMNIKILRFWALLYDKNIRRYVCIGLASFHIFTQMVYMMSTNEGLTGIIRNSYMLVLWINTVLRAYLLLADHDKYVALIQKFTAAYYDLLNLSDPYISRILVNLNRVGHLMARGNLFFGMLTSMGFGLYPLSSSERGERVLSFIYLNSVYIIKLSTFILFKYTTTFMSIHCFSPSLW